MGVGLTLLRQGLIFGVTALERRMFVSLEINNKDRSYEWFLAWMSRQNRASRWFASHELSVETTVEQRKNGSSSALFNLVAGPGTHWFKYRGAWMKAKSILETCIIPIIYTPLTGETRARDTVDATHGCALGNSHPNYTISGSLALSPPTHRSERFSNAWPRGEAGDPHCMGHRMETLWATKAKTSAS